MVWFFSPEQVEVWTPEVRLLPNEEDVRDVLGAQIAVDGNLVAVDSFDEKLSSYIYIYKYSDGQWIKQTRVRPQRQNPNEI
jgi:hypothetical protein